MSNLFVEPHVSDKHASNVPEKSAQRGDCHHKRASSGITVAVKGALHAR